MQQIYKALYTGTLSGAPTRNARPAIVIANGDMHCEEVLFIPQGFLTRLIVRQADGTECNANIYLLDSEYPFPVGNYINTTNPVDETDLYEIIAPQLLTSPGPGVYGKLDIVNNEAGYPFVNQDNGYTAGKRAIYLVIQPINPIDETTWDVSITAYRDMSS